MALIKNPYIRQKTTEILTFSVADKLNQLSDVQKVNQKVVLSFYGNKIDLPFKLLPNSRPITLKVDKAIVTSDSGLIQGYKLEMTHPLGKMYCRFDIPNEVTPSQMGGDAYALADLNIKSKREFEDYLISRKQYDLDFSSMDLSHRQARLERKYEYVTKGIDLALGTLSFGFASLKGAHTIGNIVKGSMKKAKETYASDLKIYEWLTRKGLSFGMADRKPKRQWFAPVAYKNKEMGLTMALGAYKGASGIATGIAGLISASERAALQEESFGIQIREKALKSYEIDLSYEREKEDQLMTMRRIFSNESFNDVSSRTRQKKLDNLEDELTTESPEIYLEFWTTAGEQEDYVKDYHNKWGVQCRVAEQMLTIKNGIETGIYCMEDPEILNLEDRVDFAVLKSRLIGGIKFIDWVEHEKSEQLIPVDPRITKLQKALQLAEQKQVELEQHLLIQTNRYAEVQQQLTGALEQQHQLEDENRQTKQQLESKTQEYHTLSESYRAKEGELAEQVKLVGLYRDEVSHLKKDLLEESSKHSSEKEGHSSTKQELEQKKLENQTLTSQIDQQIQKISEIEKNNKELTEVVATYTKNIQAKDKQIESDALRVKEAEEKARTLEQQNQAQVQQINELARKQLTTVQELEDTKKSLEAVREIEKQLREQLGTAGVDIKHITQMINRFWVFQQADSSRHPLKQISKYLAVVLKRENAFVVTRIAFAKVKEYWIPYLALIEEDDKATAWPKLNKSKSLYKSESYGGFVLSQDTIKTTYWGTGYNSYYSKKITTWSDVKAHLLQYFSDPNGNKTTAIQMDYKYNFLFSEQWYPVFKKLVDNGKDWPDKSAKIIIGTYWDKTLKWFHSDYMVYMRDRERYEMLTTFQEYVKCLLGFDPWEGDS